MKIHIYHSNPLLRIREGCSISLFSYSPHRLVFQSFCSITVRGHRLHLFRSFLPVQFAESCNWDTTTTAGDDIRRDSFKINHIPFISGKGRSNGRLNGRVKGGPVETHRDRLFGENSKWCNGCNNILMVYMVHGILKSKWIILNERICVKIHLYVIMNKIYKIL